MGASESREAADSENSNRDEPGLYSGLMDQVKVEPMKAAAAVAVVAASAVLVGLAVSKMSNCSGAISGASKMMKAPGTGGTSFIYRHVFQENPGAYFRGLRMK